MTKDEIAEKYGIDGGIIPDLQAGDPHSYSYITNQPPYQLWCIEPCSPSGWSVRMDDITNQEWFASKGGFTLLGVAGALHMWGLVGPVEWKAQIPQPEGK